MKLTLDSKDSAMVSGTVVLRRQRSPATALKWHLLPYLTIKMGRNSICIGTKKDFNGCKRTQAVLSHSKGEVTAGFLMTATFVGADSAFVKWA